MSGSAVQLPSLPAPAYEDPGCNVSSSQTNAIQVATAEFVQVEVSVVANAMVSIQVTACDGTFATEGIITLSMEENLSHYSWRYEGGILIMDNINI